MNIDSFQKQQWESLRLNPIISYKEIIEIMTAFQIASGQSFAIGKTKALIEYLKKGNSIVIENFDYSNENKVVSSKMELVNIYKDIDQFIDLTTDKDFKEYF